MEKLVRQQIINSGVSLYSGANLGRNADVVCEAPCKLGGDISFKGFVGAYTYVRKGSRLSPALRSIGRFCSIAPGALIGDSNHPVDWLSTHPFQWGATPLVSEKAGITKFKKANRSIEIGNDVWVGTSVVITPGVTIGNGAIIAAGCVVVKDVPPYAIVGGVPGKIIRYRFDEKTIRALEMAEWWKYTPESLLGLPFDEPLMALQVLYKKKAAGDLDLLKPSVVRVLPTGASAVAPSLAESSPETHSTNAKTARFSFVQRFLPRAR